MFKIKYTPDSLQSNATFDKTHIIIIAVNIKLFYSHGALLNHYASLTPKTRAVLLGE